MNSSCGQFVYSIHTIKLNITHAVFDLFLHYFVHMVKLNCVDLDVSL